MILGLNPHVGCQKITRSGVKGRRADDLRNVVEQFSTKYIDNDEQVTTDEIGIKD